MARGGHRLPKVLPGLSCPTLLCPAGEPPLTAVSRVVRPQGRWPVAVFYPFPTPRRVPMLLRECEPVEEQGQPVVVMGRAL
jgi:hypothetical protein